MRKKTLPAADSASQQGGEASVSPVRAPVLPSQAPSKYVGVFGLSLGHRTKHRRRALHHHVENAHQPPGLPTERHFYGTRDCYSRRQGSILPRQRRRSVSLRAGFLARRHRGVARVLPGAGASKTGGGEAPAFRQGSTFLACFLVYYPLSNTFLFKTILFGSFLIEHYCPS